MMRGLVGHCEVDRVLKRLEIDQGGWRMGSFLGRLVKEQKAWSQYAGRVLSDWSHGAKRSNIK